jgi:signal transduction histidine kinase/CheY-like chemotaxis protein
MTIRLKVIFVIVFIAIVIIIISIGSGLVFVQGSLEQSIENDMTVVANIADRLITTAINLLKADASIVGQHLLETSEDDFRDTLQQQAKIYKNFIALTVFNSEGIVDSYSTSSSAAASEEFVKSEYVQRAFAGESVVSTTQFSPGGELVYYLCVPMGTYVLSATVPAMFFSDILANFTIWETGNIFIVDAEGTILANVRRNWVFERNNFIERAKTESQYERVAGTIRSMVEGKSGVGRYVMEGVERLCVYMPISGSRVGWSLGVVAPLTESPIQNVRNGLLFVGVVCLLLSIAAAFFASIILELPYKTISDLAASLENRDKLLHIINDAAARLLRTEPGNFDSDIWNSMDMIARCAGVDRMRIWKNHIKNDELYCSQIYEWSGGVEPQSGKRIAVDVPYSQNMPGWEEKLSAGQSINRLAHDFSPEEQAQLSPQGVLSILVIPVFFQGIFWGFVCFDNCHKEQVYSGEDEDLLRSGGLLIAHAILRNEMTHDLVRAREEALASAEAKTDFLANMSHEMRTPLNAIIGLSELTLDSGEVDGIAEENLEKVYTSGVILLSLINDILDVSKIEAGRFELIPVEYNVPSLVNDTVTLNIVRIGSKPLTFQLDIDENMPSSLIGDELRLKQIFNNLLSNAFKYTKEGSIIWRVSCETEGEDLWLVSSVKDSGIGIHPEDLEKIFSEYNQVDTKSNRKIEGTGLGLSICKNIVELMDGKITVESEYGKGSTFTVRIRQRRINSIPIGPIIAENLKKYQYSENKRDRSSKLVRAHIPYARVLVVDDVPTNLDVAKGMMKPYGMHIDCVTSGPAAIDLIRNAQNKYNAIFMDHMMPNMDGIEATRIIREEIGTEYARTIPIIALTANAIVGNEDMFLKNGFQAFLSKPIDIMRMDVIINHFVRDKEQERTPPADKNTPQGIPDLRSDNDRGNIERKSNFDRRWFDRLNASGLDIEQGLKRFSDDEEGYLDVLKSYVLNTPPLLDQLRNRTEENLPNYSIVVHGLKSSSRSIGAEPVGAQAEALEFAAKAGNFALVDGKTDGFIETVRTLLKNLSDILQEIAGNNPKPKKAAPDASVLTALMEACKSFDIDEVDKAMDDLESYAYESGSELVEWLRTQLNLMKFEQIAERLSNEQENFL